MKTQDRSFTKTILWITLTVVGLLTLSALKPFRFSQEPPKLDPIVVDRQRYEASFIDEKYKNPQPWFPNEADPVEASLEKPKIKGRHVLFIDNLSGSVMYDKDSKKRVPVASLVKIMTAVIALEHAKPEEIFEISGRAANTGENFMGISTGEKYTLEELLYGLILPSGNDAAEAITEGVAGKRNTFINWMNFKAEELGLEDTKFTNPSGLEDGEFQYSTAYDLIRLAHYAWETHPLLREIAGTKSYEIPYNEDHKALYFENQTNLLGTYPGVKGIKTGYTEEAGLCLITIAENEGKEVLGVILNSTDRRGDAILLYDYSFAVLGVNIVHNLVR